MHAHFNHPDTDIVIDGVAYQIKATDDASYVDSVDDEIPIIATSEIAGLTGDIDVGCSNEEVTRTVDLALGGAVLDAGDTAVDALLSGLGGLGILATAKGINHAAERYENGGDAVESLFEGLGVTLDRTASAAVGTLELGFKVLASRPSRFVGRAALRVIKKLDDRIMREAPRND